MRSIVVLVFVLAAASCGGRTPLPIGGGDDDDRDGGGTTDRGRDGRPVGCTGLARAECEADRGCRFDLCPSCDGTLVGLCVSADLGSTCPDLGCGECGSIGDENSCLGSGCVPSYCPDCNGGVLFAQCCNPDEDCLTTCPGACPQPFCKEIFDELACQQTPGCRADYCADCFSSRFIGCFDAREPSIECPPIACPMDCRGFGEADCARFGCRPDYCPDCGVGRFVGCANPNDGFPGCPPIPPCNDCGIQDQFSCHQRSDCVPQYCPFCDGTGETFYAYCRNGFQGPDACETSFCPEQDCRAVFTEGDCIAKAFCHPVYDSSGNFFSCGEGKLADCTGPAFCPASPPPCVMPFSLSFKNGCYEGCVRNALSCSRR